MTGDGGLRRRAAVLRSTSVESARMGSGILIMALFGPFGLLGVPFVLLASWRLSTTPEIRRGRPWWWAVGALVAATSVVGLWDFWGQMSSADGTAPLGPGVVLVWMWALLGLSVVLGWDATLRELGEPMQRSRVAANMLAVAAASVVLLAAGNALGGSSTTSADASGGWPIPRAVTSGLGGTAVLMLVVALWVFSRAQQWSRASMQATAEACDSAAEARAAAHT